MGRRPAKFRKSTGSAGGLAAGDLPGFLELRGGFFFDPVTVLCFR
jgi:hypothetical protein